MFIQNPNVGNRTQTEDWRITGYNPLTPPDLLQSEFPLKAINEKVILKGFLNWIIWFSLFSLFFTGNVLQIYIDALQIITSSQYSHKSM